MGMMKKEVGSFRKWFSKTIGRSPSSLAGFTIVAFFILMATIGPIVYPFDNTYLPGKRYLPPSLEHPLGTDFVGRDVLAQIISGSRDVMLVAFLTGAMTTIFAIMIGVSSGMIGGTFDASLMLIADIFLIIPSFPLLLIIAVSIPRVMTPPEVALIISITGWAGLARTIRSQVLSIREKPFIEAARSLNLSNVHILFNEILPNLMPYIVMSLILAMKNAIYSQVGLFFLGALPFTSVNWGIMINIGLYSEYALLNPKAWIYLFSPMVCIVLIQTGLLFMLSGLEEIFNPRLRSEE